ncbi:MAG: CHAT domain-containing protein [Woronichinia naegeliana WA131]|uniref:CHAT domain-containing protein n=1 Tax=Woronichinia naegeliana WA131 TaxID=2824559 RepID=A0A977KWS4_9CYAN|nr:MAG: CHAT domain-containing protein [Woronichinia naegeliana WA131]
MNTSQINVLVVFANPRGTSPLRLSTEDRVIRESIRLSRYRNDISLTIRHATTVHDLRRSLLDEDFQIVHISGHGTGSGLVLEDDAGGIYVPPQQALADLFQAYKSIQCVILNACYSISQGELMSLGIPFTIGMEGSIGCDL